MSAKVITIGEIVWDALPKGIYLGGAPLNVAVNLSNLGIETTVVSAVGDDQLGRLTKSYLQRLGMSTHAIQTNNLDTGLVEVDVDSHGIPDYYIHQPSSWDSIEFNDNVRNELQTAAFVVTGSLVFRSETSSKTIKEWLTNRGENCKLVVDVNFRKDGYSKELILELFELADIIKVNDEELLEIEEWLGWSHDYKKSLIRLTDEFNLDSILLTRGAHGSTIYRNEVFVEKDRYIIKVKDTVGAGDAFLAGALYGILNYESSDSIISFANAMGAFVASRNGATPALNVEKIKSEVYQ